jgi:hypothetical protein
MIEQDASPTTGPGDDAVPIGASSGSASLCGDPALELFGNGWSPHSGLASNTDYTGRHRAPDAYSRVARSGPGVATSTSAHSSTTNTLSVETLLEGRRQE